MRSVIYETSGRAREFNELAINLFSGCGHRCIYCYGPDVTHTNKGKFENYPQPRVTADNIRRSAFSYQGDKRPILLCFICDPYQPIEQDTKLTRTAIAILKENGLRVTILTKAGLRATRDFDLLRPGEDAFATTLTCMHAQDSLYWEPGAALPVERIRSLMLAHEKGLETWVSLEPVIYPRDAIYLMQITRAFVDHFKVGPINYSGRLPDFARKQVQEINWKAFGWEIKSEMDKLGVKYLLKKDLLKKMQ